MFTLNSVNAIVLNPSNWYANYTPYIVENIQFKYDQKKYNPESAISTIAASSQALGFKLPNYVTPFYMAKAAMILSDGLRTYQIEDEKRITIHLVSHEKKVGRVMAFKIEYKVRGRKSLCVRVGSDGMINIYVNNEFYMYWGPSNESERNNHLFINDAKEARAEIFELLSKEDPYKDFYAPINYEEKIANTEKKEKVKAPIVHNITTIEVPLSQCELTKDGRIKINLSIVIDR